MRTARSEHRAGGLTRRSDSGFSLVEMVVATGLLIGGLVAIAQLFLVAIDATHWSGSATMSTTLAVQKLEQLRSLSFYVDETGAPVTDFTSDLSVDPPLAAGGPGLQASPPGALAADTPGCVDFLDETGRWLGNGGAAARRASYVRRWSVTPLPAAPNDALILQVVVARVSASSRAVSARAGDASMATLKSRRAR